MSNRLIDETSPYLLQHAHNPVDWYPWGPEALERARKEDKPIFLSIGYAACHWCHVMEHESFEDVETAALLNQYFVPIKVDREERPDLDSIYMNAVVAMTGQGGWPMSMFLTPEGVPFYGGTYFPNLRRHGLPGFGDVLRRVADAWQNRRAEILNSGAQVLAALNQSDMPGAMATDAPLDKGTLDEALEKVYRAFDQTNGGWGGAPKFPQPMTVEFLMRRYVATREEFVLKIITKTLDKMARGGIYDQLGGGFHRYATDAIWLVPHFEKMLYDNAQLARVYLHAWQITRDDSYRRIAQETLDYVAREMTLRLRSGQADPHGGFYSSQDADSDGVEGKFFVWTPAQIRSALAPSTALPSAPFHSAQDSAQEEAQLFIDAYGVTEHGNFEGKNILYVARDTDVLAAMHNLSVEGVEEGLASARRKLFEVREGRVKPARDEKVLTGWNGLMLEHFADAGGGFFDTSDDGEALLTRPKDLQDNAVPSGNAMAATVLLKLVAFTGEGRYSDAAERAQRIVQPALGSAPTGFAHWLSALDFALGQAKEIAIVGPSTAAQPRRPLGGMSQAVSRGTGDETQKLLDVVYGEYRPNQVVASASDPKDSPVPLLADRTPLNGHSTAYVCRNFVCQLPVTKPEELAEQLKG